MRFLFLLFLVFNLNFLKAQNFDFSLNGTSETCQNNGVIQISVLNSINGSSINYEIYKLPNLISPIVITSDLTISGLDSGIYKIIGHHSFNGVEEILEKQIELEDLTAVLDYNFISESLSCTNNGQIIVNLLSGNAQFYQIISGPITTQLQSSNVFTNLPIGEYVFKVIDSCGNVVIKTYELQYVALSVTNNLELFSTTSTNTVKVKIICPQIADQQNFPTNLFPLVYNFTYYPPNGLPAVNYNYIFNSLSELNYLNPDYYYFNIDLPFYDNSISNLVMNSMDGCNSYYSMNLEINTVQVSQVIVIEENLSGLCPEYSFELQIINMIAPYTVDFLTAPSSFNPIQFNSNHPGPFYSNNILYDSTLYSAPPGSYSVQITDSNLQSIVLNFVIEGVPPPTVSLILQNCNPILQIDYNSPIVLTSLILQSAPNGYIYTTPHDFSNLIVNNVCEIPNIIEGHYEFIAMDACGNIFELDSDVQLNNSYLSPIISQYPHCLNEQFGTIKFDYVQPIQAIEILEAPSNYPFPLPHLIPISNNYIFNNVPIGTYKIKSIFTCNYFRIDTITVQSFQFQNFEKVVDINCGSFDYYFVNSTNASINQKVYLQKLNEITMQWCHPLTMQPIVNNIVDDVSGLEIFGSYPNTNLFFSGKFRVVQRYHHFNNALEAVYCHNTFDEFEIFENLNISNEYVAQCDNNQMEIFVNAIGAEPLNYKITQKNSLPFIIDNGTNNLFQNLEIATYTYSISDNCGNVYTNTVSLNNAIQLNLNSSLICENQNVTLNVPYVPFLTYEWYLNSNPSTVLSNSNQLILPSINASNLGEYSVIINNSLNSSSCLNKVLTKQLQFEISEDAGPDKSFEICGITQNINLFTLLDTQTSQNGNWYLSSNNQLIPLGIWDTSLLSFSSYHLEYRIIDLCGNLNVSNHIITFKEIPELPTLNSNYLLCENENFELNYSNSIYEYHWILPNGDEIINNVLSLNSITSNQSGEYKLRVFNGTCGTDQVTFHILVSQPIVFSLFEDCLNSKKIIKINYVNAENSNFTLTINNVEFNQELNSYQISELGEYIFVTNNNGCEFVNSIQINSINCEFPKGLSPNGDGDNEYFDLSGFEVEELKIFNRYGREIYVQQNYIKEWYGQDFKGTLLPAATYYYVAKLKSGSSKTGWVYLQR